MYEFHYDYMLPKYAGGAGSAFGKNLRLCYMDKDALVYHIKTEDIYADIANDVELRFDTSGYDKSDARPLPIGVNKK